MNRRDAILKFSGITGLPVFLAGCSMDAVRRAESNLGWRMRQPGTGVQFSGLPEVVKVIVLANYLATPQQTRVAEQRARQAVATIVQRERKVAKTTPAKPKPSGTTVHEPKHAVVQAEPAAALPSDDMKAAAAILQQKAGTPVIAVDTAPDSRLQGSRAVMLWNTQTQRFVGNSVYDISSPPSKGQVAQWGSTTARYVGSGSL